MRYLLFIAIIAICQSVQAQTIYDVDTIYSDHQFTQWNLRANNGGSGRVTLQDNNDGTSTFNMIGILPVFYRINVHLLGIGCRVDELDALMQLVVTNDAQANYVVSTSSVSAWYSLDVCVDTDGDGIPDDEDPDDDNDGIPDDDDPCPLDATNSCDPCANNGGDADGDGVCDNDPCNGAGGDYDGDGVCDNDPCNGQGGDTDGDGICDYDPCNGKGGDTDGDGICDDDEDPCEDSGGDSDGDGICDDDDDCPDDPENLCCEENGGDADGDGCCDDNDCDSSNPCYCRNCPCADRGGDQDCDGVCADTDCDDDNDQVGAPTTSPEVDTDGDGCSDYDDPYPCNPRLGCDIENDDECCPEAITLLDPIADALVQALPNLQMTVEEESFFIQHPMTFLSKDRYPTWEVTYKGYILVDGEPVIGWWKNLIDTVRITIYAFISFFLLYCMIWKTFGLFKLR